MTEARDVEELLSERGLEVDHTTIWHWVQRYGPELEERLRHHLKPTNKSWRVDETYVRVKGRWCYLYRAIDSSGATIDFVLSRWRDAATATRLFRKALTDPSHPQPRVINTDQARLYGSAIAGVKKAGILQRRPRSWREPRRSPRIATTTHSFRYPCSALLIGVHVKTLRSAARDGRLPVTYDTRTTFRHLRARADSRRGPGVSAVVL